MHYTQKNYIHLLKSKTKHYNTKTKQNNTIGGSKNLHCVPLYNHMNNLESIDGQVRN